MASGGDEIPAELFQISKDDAVKGLHSINQQIWKIQEWAQDWKRSVFTSIPKKGNAKELSNYCSTALISYTSNGMLTILQQRGTKDDPWVGKIPWRRKRQPTPVFLPGKSHGQRSLAGYSLWGCKESEQT